jgi:hypothetical protein
MIAFLVGAAFVVSLEYIRYSRNNMRSRAGLYAAPALAAPNGHSYAATLPPFEHPTGEINPVAERPVLSDNVALSGAQVIPDQRGEQRKPEA